MGYAIIGYAIPGNCTGIVDCVSPYAMSGTDNARLDRAGEGRCEARGGEDVEARPAAGQLTYLPTRLLRDVQAVKTQSICLWACYAMSGTDIADGIAMSGTEID
eukprot:1419725-Rhodomonas_salina.2